MPMLINGWSTTIQMPDLFGGIAFAVAGLFIEREVQPPSVTVGEIDVTHMRCTVGRPKVPKTLKSYGDVKCQVIYDPAFYSAVSAIMGINTRMRVALPTGLFLNFLGWIDEVGPPSQKEGELPICDLTIKLSLLATAGAPLPGSNLLVAGDVLPTHGAAA